MKKLFVIGMLSALSVSAGALLVETTNPRGNSEAEGLHAALVARVTACHEPAKSTVTASYIQARNGVNERTALRVVPLSTPGSFAVVGTIPAQSIIEVAVTNPEYKNYRPRVLIRNDSRGVEWASARRFFSTPPSDSDVNSLLSASN